MNRTLLLGLAVVLVLAGLFVALRPETPEAPDSGSGRKVIDVSVEDGGMTPDEIEVAEGDRVTLRFTSDAPLKLHLHGYDLEAEVASDEPAELSFEANLTGRFEIEDHDEGAALGALLVQPS